MIKPTTLDMALKLNSENQALSENPVVFSLVIKFFQGKNKVEIKFGMQKKYGRKINRLTEARIKLFKPFL